MSEENTSSAPDAQDELAGSTVNPISSPATDPMKRVEEHARASIIAANGNAELLLPHVVSKLGWRQDGDDIVVFSTDGEGDDAGTHVVEQLKANPAYGAAFSSASRQETASTPPSTPPSTPAEDQPADPIQNSKQGSGAASSQPFAPASVNASNPLAIGYALRDIARGQTRVNFDA
jgi:hypothetical protein